MFLRLYPFIVQVTRVIYICSDCTIYSPKHPCNGLTSNCTYATFIRVSMPRTQPDKLASCFCCPCPLCPCPHLSLTLAIPVLNFPCSQPMDWASDLLFQSPLGSVGYLSRPISCPLSSDLEFCSMADQPILPVCNPTDGRQGPDTPSLSIPLPQCPPL